MSALMSALVGLVNLVISSLGFLANFLVELLPTSPFQSYLSNLDIPYLSSLNWVIPFDFMLNITGMWVGAISIYYLASIGLRWAKAIE